MLFEWRRQVKGASGRNVAPKGISPSPENMLWMSVGKSGAQGRRAGGGYLFGGIQVFGAAGFSGQRTYQQFHALGWMRMFNDGSK